MLMNTKVSKEAPSNRYKAIEEGASLLYFLFTLLTYYGVCCTI